MWIDREITVYQDEFDRISSGVQTFVVVRMMDEHKYQQLCAGERVRLISKDSGMHVTRFVAHTEACGGSNWLCVGLGRRRTQSILGTDTIRRALRLVEQLTLDEGVLHVRQVMVGGVPTGWSVYRQRSATDPGEEVFFVPASQGEELAIGLSDVGRLLDELARDAQHTRGVLERNTEFKHAVLGCLDRDARMDIARRYAVLVRESVWSQRDYSKFRQFLEATMRVIEYLTSTGWDEEDDEGEELWKERTP